MGLVLIDIHQFHSVCTWPLAGEKDTFPSISSCLFPIEQLVFLQVHRILANYFHTTSRGRDVTYEGVIYLMKCWLAIKKKDAFDDDVEELYFGRCGLHMAVGSDLMFHDQRGKNRMVGDL